MAVNPKVEEVLARVEPGRRDAMRKILASAVYAAPVVASFSMASLDASAVPANFCANQTDVVVAPGGAAIQLRNCDHPVPATSPLSVAALAGALGAAGAYLVRRRREG